MNGTDQLTTTTTSTANDTLSVFMSWILTPTGAVLMLLLIFIGGGSVVMKILGRSVRVLSIAGKIVCVLFFVWVIGGVLEAFGIPVRETLATIGGYLPMLVGKFLDFVARLFTVANS
ncbi:hypothetical protein [Bifidobacterium callitrichidarum]|uniref:Uncharacterized protein n=1 Tax=Bifidobacterium callitrichidarum TaxID=2052941 RepID=A0A2U2NC99_9BIFI|nr:hypothetical protein [Bifidobacterium callitrichidarum]PWG66710.1 hypothetical protein DF196_02055 [Bifidobacterium callitrichidarum]